MSSTGDVIPNQDGVESFRRMMLEEYPGRKAAIDKLLGQTAARAVRQGFGKAVQTEGLYAYPTVDGTLPQLIDRAELDARELAELRAQVLELTERRLRDPFGEG